MEKVIIVIPIYKSKPSTSEVASFKQCLKILHGYDISIVSHCDINLSLYTDIVSDKSVLGRKKINVELFDKDYFASVFDYNRLCLSAEFYERFRNYEYMLIYHLDAWVFRDELKDWCDKGYDYVGAPWFNEESEENKLSFVNIVGNGGLSLRKISFCIDVVSKPNRWPILTPRGIIKVHGLSLIDIIKFPLRLIGIKNCTASYINEDNRRKFLDEDLLFARYKYSYKNYRIPEAKIAMKFAFETHPSFLYELNGGELPFGCHAYRKHEYETFWKKYINE